MKKNSDRERGLINQVWLGGAATERKDASQEIVDIIAEGIAQIELSLRASAVEVINASQWVALMERDLGQARTPGELEVCKRRTAEADANLKKIEQEWGFFMKAMSPHDRGNAWIKWRDMADRALADYRIVLNAGVNHPDIASVTDEIDELVELMPEASSPEELEKKAKIRYQAASPETIRKWGSSGDLVGRIVVAAQGGVV